MRLDVWFACACFLVGAAASSSLKRKSFTLSAWILCASAALGVFAILKNAANPYAILAFLLPITFAAFLMDWRQATLFSTLTLAPVIYLWLL